MSKITQIRADLQAIMDSQLTGYTKLSDSIETVDNPSLNLIKGYMLAYGPSERATDELCQGFIRIRRQFQVILTNIYWANLDAAQRTALEDALMEDQFKVLKAIERSPTLTGENINSYYVTDNGLEYIIEDRKQYIVIGITVLVDYYERTS